MTDSVPPYRSSPETLSIGEVQFFECEPITDPAELAAASEQVRRRFEAGQMKP